jgi:iron complex transport system permease protein
MDELDIEIMMELTMRGFSSNTSISFSTISFYVMLIATIIGILPVHLMRFSFCAVSFSDEEVLSMGVNPRVMRTISILGVTLLVASAIIHCGNVGILALVVPHVCRYWVGAKFKPLYYAGIFFGGLVLVLCRAISSLIYIECFGSFPLGPLVTLTAMPILAMALMQRRRGWE